MSQSFLVLAFPIIFQHFQDHAGTIINLALSLTFFATVVATCS